MARSFNGSSDYLVRDASVDMSSYQKGAYAMWLWVDSYSGTGNHAALTHYTGSTGNPRFKVYPDINGTTFYVEYVDSAAATGQITRPTAGQWNHIVINIDLTVASSEIASIYVNGSSQSIDRSAGDGNNSGNLPTGNGTNDFALMSNTTVSEYLAGRIAEVAIWGGVNLSGTDVSNLWNSGNGTSATNVQNGNLVYYWQVCGTASPEPNTTGGVDLTLSASAPPSVTHPISGAGICGGVVAAAVGTAPMGGLFKLKGYRGYS